MRPLAIFWLLELCQEPVIQFSGKLEAKIIKNHKKYEEEAAAGDTTINQRNGAWG